MCERKLPKFLKKLYYILDQEQYEKAICWDKFGQYIIICDTDVLKSEIIPSHFSLRKMSSFIRQLHLYDFHKLKTSNSAELVFQNQLFKRQDRFLAYQIVRKRKTKQQMLREVSGLETEQKLEECRLTKEEYKISEEDIDSQIKLNLFGKIREENSFGDIFDIIDIV